MTHRSGAGRRGVTELRLGELSRKACDKLRRERCDEPREEAPGHPLYYEGALVEAIGGGADRLALSGTTGMVMSFTGGWSGWRRRRSGSATL